MASQARPTTPPPDIRWGRATSHGRNAGAPGAVLTVKMRRPLLLVWLTSLLVAACSATQTPAPGSTVPVPPAASNAAAQDSGGISAVPQVTCEVNIADCAAETRAVLQAVASVGHPVVRVAFQTEAMCIWYPFLGGVHSCPDIAVPDGALRMTSAVVTFADTDQQAFLNVAWLADGTFRTTMALVNPPPGATPFQVLGP